MTARYSLPDETVMNIRRERSQGAKLDELAAKYGIGKSNVSQIVNGKRYAHLPILANPVHPPQRRRVDSGRIREMRRRYADGETLTDIAEGYGLDISTLSKYMSQVPAPDGPEWQRVDAVTGAQYRDTLIRIAEMDGEAAALARSVLGL